MAGRKNLVVVGTLRHGGGRQFKTSLLVAEVNFFTTFFLHNLSFVSFYILF
jgi:hypothetical protein